MAFSNGCVKRTESLTGVVRRRYALSDVEQIITDHGQETEDPEPGHTLAEMQVGEEEMIAEENAPEYPARGSGA